MTIFQSSTALPAIPDNITIPQFILSELQLSSRPVRPRNVPYFIDNGSGRSYNHHQVGLLAADYGKLTVVIQGPPSNIWSC